MTVTLILASISAIVIVLAAAERIPRALAAFIRSCIPLVQALGELRAAFAHAIRRPAVPGAPPGGKKGLASRSPAREGKNSTATGA